MWLDCLFVGFWFFAPFHLFLMTTWIAFPNPPSTDLTALSDSCNQIPVCLTANTSTSEMLTDCSGNRIEAVQAPLKILF